MPSDLPHGDRVVYVFLEMLSLALLFTAIDGLLNGKLSTFFVCIVAAIVFFAAGIRIIAIKRLLGLRTSSLQTGNINKEPVTANDGTKRMFLQLFVGCSSQHGLDNCRGYMKRLQRWSEGTGGWSVLINSPVPLLWGNIDVESCSLIADMSQPLNIFFVDENNKFPILWTRQVPNTMMSVLRTMTPSDVLKIDVMVRADGTEDAETSIEVTMAKVWDEFTAEMIP